MPAGPATACPFIEAVADRIADGRSTRRSLPGGGRLHVERRLPYLVVYRRPRGRDDPGTERLVSAHGAYLTAGPGPDRGAFVRDLTARVATLQAAVFGAVLVVEVWSDPDLVADHDAPEASAPRFRLHLSRTRAHARYVQHLLAELGRIRIAKRRAEVEVVHTPRPSPPGLRPLLTPAQREASSAHLIGLELAPIHLGRDGREFPLIRRDLRRQLTRVLSSAFYAFARDETSSRPRSYHALGRRATVEAVWEIDAELAELGGSYDLLLLVTPTNGEAAWRRFRRGGYQRAPTFHYRPCPVDPSALKRRLFTVRIDRVEDPALADLFDQQRQTLDRQLSLLQGRERPSFLYDSLALHGRVDDRLWDLATRILGQVAPGTRRSDRGRLRGEQFASVAARELQHYAHLAPDLQAGIEVRDDVTGLMVSDGNLLVARHARIPRWRVEALLHHEVGTHLVTAYNGRKQRLRLLACGLAGYESLQEGLGVFAEYLAGGLSRSRLRTLAGRVVACRLVADGAGFAETFREMTGTYGFGERAAFTLTMRVHRGGGFVKDAIYLRGLEEVFTYLRDGGRMDTLLAGKMAMSQVPTIRELQRREVLAPPALRPRYLETERATRRLDAVRGGFSFDDLVEELAG